MPKACKQREHLLTTGVIDVPALPASAVRGTLCFRCFSPAAEILKCGACRRTGYCSKECQKLDWGIAHKKQCKVLKQINQLDLEDYRKTRSWDEYRGAQLKYVRMAREMGAGGDTEFIVQAQPYCSTCRRSANQLSHQNMALKECGACHLAHYCDDCPQSHESSVCADYQTVMTVENFRIDLFEETGRASAMTCTQIPRKTHSPLDRCTGWYDYFVNVSDKGEIKGIVSSDFSKILSSTSLAGLTERQFQERRRLFLTLATDNLTIPLTIISTLESLDLHVTPNLKIHLLGATSREFLAMPSFEEILHLLPAARSLSITAIGPSCPSKSPTEPYHPPQPIECCDPCKATRRTRSFASYAGVYHDFVRTAAYSPPTLIVAFNSGCADGDDATSHWDPTLQLITRSGSDVPALFTTYNADEARNEGEKMGRLGAKFLIEPSENRWAGLVREMEFLDREGGSWRQNAWVYVVRGGQ